MGAVAQAFALHEPSLTPKIQDDRPGDKGKVTEPAVTADRGETDYSQLQPFSLEDTRRQARENW